MRFVLAVVVVLGLSPLAAAQSHRPPAKQGSAPSGPRPSIGLPLPPIGLPLPPIGLPPSRLQPPVDTNPPRQGFRNPPVRRFDRQFDQRFDRGFNQQFGGRFDQRFDRNRWMRSRQTVVLFPPYGWDQIFLDPAIPVSQYPLAPVYGPQFPTDQFQYPVTPPYPYSFPGSDVEEPPPSVGQVLLELQDDVNPQVYVDGYYVGTVGDIGGVLTLDAGVHALELRAAGYEGVAFDVQVPADRT